MKYYEHIELTLEETVRAIEEAKRKKYFHEKNKPYWQSLEKKGSKPAQRTEGK